MFGATSDAVSEPSSTLAEVTALLTSFDVVTAPSASWGVATALAAMFCVVTAPAPRLLVRTDPVERLMCFTCPGPIFLLVMAPFLICAPVIRLVAQLVPPTATNSAVTDSASAARDVLNLRIAPPVARGPTGKPSGRWFTRQCAS